MSHHMIEDEGGDFGFVKTCMMVVSGWQEVNQKSIASSVHGIFKTMRFKKDITLDFVMTNRQWSLAKLLSFTTKIGQDIEW